MRLEENITELQEVIRDVGIAEYTVKNIDWELVDTLKAKQHYLVEEIKRYPLNLIHEALAALKIRKNHLALSDKLLDMLYKNSYEKPLKTIYDK